MSLCHSPDPILSNVLVISFREEGIYTIFDNWILLDFYPAAVVNFLFLINMK